MKVVFISNIRGGFLNLGGIKQVQSTTSTDRRMKRLVWKVTFDDGRITEIKSSEYNLIQVDA